MMARDRARKARVGVLVMRSPQPRTSWIIEAIWPGQLLHRSTTLSWIGNSVGDPLRLTPGS